MGFPRVRGHWLFGNILAFRDYAIPTLEAAHRTHGPNFALDMRLKHIFVLGHPDAVRHVLMKNAVNYVVASSPARSEIRRVAGMGILTTDGAPWSRLRKSQQPAFQLPRLAPFVERIIHYTRALVDDWRRSHLDAPFEPFRELMRLMQKIGLDLLFGYEAANDEADGANDALLAGQRRAWANMFRPIEVPALFDREARRGARTFSTIADRILDAAVVRSGEPTLLHALLDLDGTDREEQRSQIRTYLISLPENPSNAMSWLLGRIAQHPDVAAKLVDEITRVLGDRDPTLDDLPRLAYLQRVIDETLRLHPGSWILDRVSVAEDEVMGVRIPAKQTVLVSPYLLHRSPELWRDPEHFDPDRFLPEHVEARPKHHYIPFGAGPHHCIGDRLARLELQLVLPVLLREFRFELVSPLPIRPVTGFMLRPRELRFRLHPRARSTS